MGRQQPAAPSATSPHLTRGVWLWIRTEYSDHSTLRSPDPNAYTLASMDDGRLTIEADCNTVMTTYILSGSAPHDPARRLNPGRLPTRLARYGLLARRDAGRHVCLRRATAGAQYCAGRWQHDLQSATADCGRGTVGKGSRWQSRTRARNVIAHVVLTRSTVHGEAKKWGQGSQGSRRWLAADWEIARHCTRCQCPGLSLRRRPVRAGRRGSKTIGVPCGGYVPRPASAKRLMNVRTVKPLAKAEAGH